MYSTGVTVHLIEPGFFATPLVGFFTEDNVRRQLTETFEKLPEEIKERYSEDYLEKCKYVLLRTDFFMYKLLLILTLSTLGKMF